MFMKPHKKSNYPPDESIPPPASTGSGLPFKIDRRRAEKFLWRGKVGPAFWTIASLLSLSVNIVLLALLIGVGRELFAIKKLVTDEVLGGLYTNFVKMDEAHIMTTILVSDTIIVEDTIPVKFDLALNQETDVVLTQETSIPDTLINLNGAWLQVPIRLPEGTPLRIQLDLNVPVDKMVPVTLNVPVQLQVPVDIPLRQTELHRPFVGLQEVIAPYYGLLSEQPESWGETPLCGPGRAWLCNVLFKP